MSTRLSDAALAGLPAGIGRPGFDRRALTPGIVHLGLGAFARAHLLAYTQRAMEATGATDWGVLGASLQSPATRDALAPQGWLYAQAVRAPGDDGVTVNGTLCGILVAPEDPAALLAAMTRPETRIVSLTVTEKGYCHDPATGRLDRGHPGIVRDLATPDRPVTAPGFLVEALARRRAAGIAPFTPLACDNLPDNGRLLGRLVQDLAAARDPALAEWIGAQVPFPATMVDRIVPATTDDDRTRVADRLGVADAGPVVAEPFSMWVVEDRFAAGRPAWERTGVDLVDDVGPWERAKLRLLNASHSALAYLGYLAGFETIAETVAQPAFRRFVEGLMEEEASPLLDLDRVAGIAAYRGAIIERFANPALHHRTWQIAMDGSQKLPQRLLGTIRDNLAAGLPIGRLCLAVAAWMRYVAGMDERGRPIDVRDPLADLLRRRAAAAGDQPRARVEALAAVEAVFGQDLPANQVFIDTVTEALTALRDRGAAATVAAWAEGAADQKRARP